MIKVNPETGFIYDDSGVFYPPLNSKQLEIFNDTHRYLLVHGPRMSGKTFGIIHKVIRHAFDVDGAMVGIVCKTLKSAKSAGVWLLLCRMMAFWEARCFGFQIVEGPKTAGDTKLSFVRIRNRHGGVSEIQCHSLEHAQEVEAKFKSSAYSMFWLSEVDQFCTEHAFDIMCDALRMTPFVPFNSHQLIADCNPPDTGTQNWMHDKFFKFKDAAPEPDEPPATAINRARHHRILVMIDDNPQLDPEAKSDLIERYRKRKAWYNRFVLGIWERDIVDGHFSDVYDESKHVLGTADGPEDDREFLVPTAGCTTLLTGWDIGEKNHSFHILEKITREDPVTKRSIVSFSVLDENVVINTRMSIHEFTKECLEKMDFWANWQKKNHNITVQWRHWSDDSAFSYRASTNSCDAALVYEASAGRIALVGAPKYSQSNRDKVKLLWQLMHGMRLFISAQLHVTKTMFANLRTDKSNVAHFVKRDEHKHPFDSLSYPILAEVPTDMLKSADLSTAAGQPAKPTGFVVARV